jgi:hypothetical protein
MIYNLFRMSKDWGKIIFMFDKWNQPFMYGNQTKLSWVLLMSVIKPIWSIWPFLYIFFFRIFYLEIFYYFFYLKFAKRKLFFLLWLKGSTNNMVLHVVVLSISSLLQIIYILWNLECEWETSNCMQEIFPK